MGYPALEVPKSAILANGTSDPLADADVQMQIDSSTLIFKRPIGDWDIIQGELVTFTDPFFELPPIERLEGFRPKGDSMYQRVLVTINSEPMLYTTWVCEGSPMRLRLFSRVLNGY